MKSLSFYKGWEGVDKTRSLKRSNEKLIDARQYGKTLINQKQTEHLKSFIFWPSPDKRCGESIYEISTYELIPGTFFRNILTFITVWDIFPVLDHIQIISKANRL